MNHPIHDLQRCQQALAANGFEVFCTQTPAQAKELFFNCILPKLRVTTAWGDSITLHATRVLDALFLRQDIKTIKTFAAGIDRLELLERRRQALLTDLFLTGTNAVT